MYSYMKFAVVYLREFADVRYLEHYWHITQQRSVWTFYLLKNLDRSDRDT